MQEIITTGEDTIERIVVQHYGATSPDDIKQLVDHVHAANPAAGHLSMLSVGQAISLPAWPPAESAESPEPGSEDDKDKTDELPAIKV